MEDQKNQECFVCGVKSEERVLLECVHEGDSKYVCVRCLPPLIHGGVNKS